jgi:hypothetical protein
MSIRMVPLADDAEDPPLEEPEDPSLEDPDELHAAASSADAASADAARARRPIRLLGIFATPVYCLARRVRRTAAGSRAMRHCSRSRANMGDVPPSAGLVAPMLHHRLASLNQMQYFDYENLDSSETGTPHAVW